MIMRNGNDINRRQGIHSVKGDGLYRLGAINFMGKTMIGEHGIRQYSSYHPFRYNTVA